jgi:hypothetical protein
MAGRLMVAAVIVPPLVLAVLASWEVPVPRSARTLTDWSPVALFAMVGAWVGGVWPQQSAGRRWLGAAFGAAGLVVVPAYQSLQGLSGREPLLLVAGIVAGSFGLGFGAIATGGAVALGLEGRQRLRLGLRGCGAGVAGGALALAPVIANAIGLGAAGPYVRVPLAVVAVFGCLAVPSHLLGATLDEAASGGGAT